MVSESQTPNGRIPTDKPIYQKFRGSVMRQPDEVQRDDPFDAQRAVLFDDGR